MKQNYLLSFIPPMVRSLHKSYDRLLSRFEHVWTLQLSGHAGWSAGKHGVLPQDFVRKLAWACDPGVANCTFYSLPTWEPDTVALRWRVLWNWKLKKEDDVSAKDHGSQPAFIPGTQTHRKAHSFQQRERHSWQKRRIRDNVCNPCHDQCLTYSCF